MIIKLLTVKVCRHFHENFWRSYRRKTTVILWEIMVFWRTRYSSVIYNKQRLLYICELKVKRNAQCNV